MLLLAGCGPQPVDADPPGADPGIEKPAIEAAADYSMIPGRCLGYREAIESVADCPARRAALMEQESGCNPLAKSRYANGLWQITPKTGRSLARGLCLSLGPYQPFNPQWATPCANLLLKQNTAGDYSLDGLRTGELKYNGGWYIVWEKEQAKRAGLSPTVENAEGYCGTKLYNGRKRADWACKENYGYFRHIERRLPKYHDYQRGLCS